jgi:hypothetical protein
MASKEINTMKQGITITMIRGAWIVEGEDARRLRSYLGGGIVITEKKGRITTSGPAWSANIVAQRAQQAGLDITWKEGTP